MEELETLVRQKIGEVTKEGRYAIGYLQAGKLLWRTDEDLHRLQNTYVQMFSVSCCSVPPYAVIDRKLRRIIPRQEFWEG